MMLATWLPLWAIELLLLGTCKVVGYGALLAAGGVLAGRKR